MKFLLIVLLAASFSAFSGLVEFGGHAGVLIPTGDDLDRFNTSPVFGVDILAHLPMFAIEGSVSYAPLSNDGLPGATDYSANMIPLLAGIRTYSGPIFYGGGLALHITSVSFTNYGGDKVDNTESKFGAYGNVGMILPTGGMDIEASLKYHLVDLDFDETWLGLTAGINF
ncbi:MAG: hypothetical protein KAQ97_09075 [Candidatus Fermentibacteraceae bacterium]|nr:hypothetical protein [Candidatus Fermentibacteraceae bacterium]